MTIDEKLDQIIEALKRIEARQVGLGEIKGSAPPYGQPEQIIKALERIEARQVVGLQEIKKSAPPVMGSFASTSEPER
jgi:hypothetical protein